VGWDWQLAAMGHCCLHGEEQLVHHAMETLHISHHMFVSITRVYVGKTVQILRRTIVEVIERVDDVHFCLSQPGPPNIYIMTNFSSSKLQSTSISTTRYFAS
jgi:hypothetical protein